MSIDVFASPPKGHGNGSIDSVVAGVYIDVDNSDPDNPVVSVEQPTSGVFEAENFQSATGPDGFASSITIEEQSGFPSSLFTSNGDPNGFVTPNHKGDLCVDVFTPALYINVGGTDSSWDLVGGGGGGFPTFSGSGAPEGVQSATQGQFYLDTDTGALWTMSQAGPQDTGWFLTSGIVSSFDNTPAMALDTSGNAVIISDGSAQVELSDVLAQLGTGNGVYWITTGTDGEQVLTIQLGDTGEFQWQFGLDGSTIFPGTINVDGSTFFAFPGDPNGNVTSLSVGDVCIDVSTPAIYQSTLTGSNSDWVIVGGGSVPTDPEFDSVGVGVAATGNAGDLGIVGHFLLPSSVSGAFPATPAISGTTMISDVTGAGTFLWEILDGGFGAPCGFVSQGGNSGVGHSPKDADQSVTIVTGTPWTNNLGWDVDLVLTLQLVAATAIAYSDGASGSPGACIVYSGAAVTQLYSITVPVAQTSTFTLTGTGGVTVLETIVHH